MERGPAGNTSLAAAIGIALETDDDKVIVVQETEYTGAGKHPTSQLTFAKNNGIKVEFGDPKDDKPGSRIILPKHLYQFRAIDVDIEDLKVRYLKTLVKNKNLESVEKEDFEFLMEDTNSSLEFVRDNLEALGVKVII